VVSQAVGIAKAWLKGQEYLSGFQGRIERDNSRADHLFLPSHLWLQNLPCLYWGSQVNSRGIWGPWHLPPLYGETGKRTVKKPTVTVRP
jgi:hypothetical protein